MSDITFSFSSDEKDVIRGLQSIGNEMGKVRGSIASLATASKEYGAADNQLAQQRLAAFGPLLSKQKELKAASDDLKKQLAEGKISADQYKESFEGLSNESNGLRAKLQQLQAQIAEDNADMKKAGTIIGQTEDKTAKYSKAVAELDRLKSKGILTSKQHATALDAERKKLEDVGDGADKSGGLIGSLTGKMAGFVGGLASLSAVTAVIRSEYDALIERQGKSADANISLATEQEALLMNLGGADAGKTFESVQKLSKDTGIKEENVTRAVNEAMAARGDLGVDAVLKAVGSVAKVRKFAPTEMAGLAAATVDTQKQTGLGTDQSLGFLMQMQGISRTKNLKSLAENFTPAIGGVMNFGADRQTAGALLGSLSHGMGDTTGAMTGTAGIQLAKQLREFSGGGDIGKTINQLQQDPEMRKKFLSGASFEAKALPAVESLLSGGTQAKDFKSFQVALQDDPLKTLKANIAARGASQSMKLAEVDQRMGGAADQMRLQDVNGGTSAVVRNRLREIRDSMGKTAVSSSIDGMLEDMSDGGVQTTASAVKRLEGMRGTLKPAKQRVFDQLQREETFDFNNKDSRERFNALAKERLSKTAEGKQDVLLQQLIDELKGLRGDQQGKAHAGVVAGRVGAGAGER